jgi:MFS transporter, ceroid-lipofuscinosis neuronal protein 7
LVKEETTMAAARGTAPAVDLLSFEDVYVKSSNVHDEAVLIDAPYVNMEQPMPTFLANNDDMEYQQSFAHSMDSSVVTVDGIQDWPGFRCVCLVILIGDMGRGVMFPSMWPLVENLGGSHVTLGYAVGAFSFGRVLVNPLFGSWSHQYGYTFTLTLSSTILLFGTLLYSQVQNVGNAEFLIFSQTIMGVGSGTLGVTRAFVADITSKRERTTYMAWITAVQYGGFTVTPFFGALFNWLLYDKDYRCGILRLNMFTAPAYFMAAVTSMTLVVLALYFKDRRHIQLEKDGKKSSKREAIEDYADSVTCIRLSVYDCCIMGCMLLNIATKGSISSFETLGIAVAASHFDLSASHAAVIVALCGTFGVMALLSMGYVSNYFDDIQLIAGGMVVMTIGIASLTTIKEGVQNATWRYGVAMFMIYAIGYPIGHTAVIGIFSKSKSFSGAMRLIGSRLQYAWY